MSRIVEALKKARQQRSATDIPDIEEIVEMGSDSGASSFQSASAGASAVPIDVIESLEIGKALASKLIRRQWRIKPGTLAFGADDTNAAVREQLRTLRSRLYQLRAAGQLQTVVVTSTLTGDGKTMVSLNLSHAFSLQKERRVLLIDADLRRSDGISSLLGIPRSPGLTDYLLGEQGADAIVQTGELDNLHVIAGGKLVENAGELVGSPRLWELIDRLRPSYDWIVIDTPPVMPISDARLIADRADGVLLVVNARSTPAKLAKRAAQQFREDAILGVVLNRCTVVGSTYYASYGYGYGNSRSAESKAK